MWEDAHLASQLRKGYSELFRLILEYVPEGDDSGKSMLNNAFYRRLSPEHQYLVYLKGYRALPQENAYRAYSELEKKADAEGMFRMVFDELYMHRAVAGIGRQIATGLQRSDPAYAGFSATLSAIGRVETAFLEKTKRLVHFNANAYRGRGLLHSELVQEGYLGALRATARFNPARGIKFETYASHWIRQSMTRALADQSRMVRHPVHMNDKARIVRRVRKDFLISEGRLPSLEEVAEKAAITVGDVKLLYREQSTVSINTSESEYEEGSLILRTDLPDSYDAVLSRQREYTIGRVLARTLTPRQERILRMRFGIGYPREHKLREVGELLGLTRERVRQLESKALQKLRKRAGSMKQLQELLG